MTTATLNPTHTIAQAGRELPAQGSGRHRQPEPHQPRRRRRLWGLPWWANLLIPTLIFGGLAVSIWTGVPLIALFTGVAALLVEDAVKKSNALLVKLFETGLAAGLTLGALIITLDVTGVLAGVL